MDGTCTIRRATPDDAAAFARSQIDAWRAAYDGILPAEFLAALDHDRMTARWQRSLTSPGEGVSQLVLCIDGQVVGWSGFGAPRDEVGDGVGEIHAINLSPAYWSRGLGSLLFAQSVRELAAMGYREAYLWVADGNARAVAFYERHGWHVDGVTQDDAGFTPPLRELRVVSPVLTPS